MKKANNFFFCQFQHSVAHKKKACKCQWNLPSKQLSHPVWTENDVYDRFLYVLVKLSSMALPQNLKWLKDVGPWLPSN